MWSRGSEKGLLSKKRKIIILEYALLLHFVWSGGSEKELLRKKIGDRINFITSIDSRKKEEEKK